VTDAMYYSVAFNIGAQNIREALGTLTIANGVDTPVVVDLSTIGGTDFNGLSTQTVWHAPTGAYVVVGNDPFGSSRVPYIATGTFGYLVQAAINAGLTANGWSASDYQVQFLENNSGSPVAFYKFVYSSAHTYQFSSVAGAQLFGNNSTTVSASASIHFLNVPRFVVMPTTQFICATRELTAFDYEPRGIGTLAIADDGSGYGIARTASPLYRDWMQQYNAPATAFRKLKTGRYSLQELFEDCRTILPFFVAHGQFASYAEYEVFRLRDAGCSWVPESASLANHAQIHIPFRTLSIGHLNSVA